MNYKTSQKVCVNEEKMDSNDVVETSRQNILRLSSYRELANIDANERYMVKETQIMIYPVPNTHLSVFKPHCLTVSSVYTL